MRIPLASLSLVALLAAHAPAFAQSQDTGIAAWERAKRTLWIGRDSYVVPKGVSTHGLSSGDTVTVTWQPQGGQRVATRVRVDRRRADEDND